MSDFSPVHLEQELQYLNPDEHHPDSQTFDSLAHDDTEEDTSDPFATISTCSLPHFFAAPPMHDDTTRDDSNFVYDWHLHSDSNSDSDSDSVSCFLTDLFENRSSRHLDDFSDASSYVNPFSEVGFEGHERNRGLGFDEVVPSERGSRVDGLRVTGFDSDSDSDAGGEGELDREVEFDEWEIENDCGRACGFDESDMGLCWDGMVFENQRTMLENPEGEELEDRGNEREDESVLIDAVEDLSVASGFSYVDETGEEAWRYVEWQILLAINNLGRDRNLEGEGGADSFAFIEDYYVAGTDFDSIFGQFVDHEFAFKASPPASKVFVENLPLVGLTVEDLERSISTCAICKDDIIVEEKLRRLPCLHYYHGDCILPWLSIHNTCPLCRFELPTDDLDYERRKDQETIHNPSRFTGQLQFGTI